MSSPCVSLHSSLAIIPSSSSNMPPAACCCLLLLAIDDDDRIDGLDEDREHRLTNDISRHVCVEVLVKEKQEEEK